MKKLMLLLAGITLLTAFTVQRLEQAEDEAAIRATVQHYFDGVVTYDIDALRRAFHPDAQIMTSFSGGQRAYYNGSFEEWAQFTGGTAPEDVSGYTNRILSIDQTDNAAVVKTELDWPEVRYVDYLSLLRINGEWKIVGKIWFQERKGS